MRKWLSVLSLLLCALLVSMPALAEDCFLINVDQLDMTQLRDDAYIAAHLTAQSQGVRVIKYISDSNELAAQVRLTIQEAETSTVVYDKNYGYVDGTFDSGDIYLPYVDNSTIPYLITLNIEDWTYAFPYMRVQQRLSGNSGCTYGVRLRDYNQSLTGDWLMGTMLDLNALRSQGTITVPLCASNLYYVGQATVQTDGNSLVVNLAFDQNANVQVDSCSVYLIGSVASLSSADPVPSSQTAYSPGQAIPIDGLSTALLYVPFTLSFDPSGLSEFSYDLGSADLSNQLFLWNANLQGS